MDADKRSKNNNGEDMVLFIKNYFCFIFFLRALCVKISYYITQNELFIFYRFYKINGNKNKNK